MIPVYSPKESKVLISREEKTHILKEFISKNMYKNLAFFFITQDDIEMDDIFLFDSFIDKEFYENVFKEIFLYFIGTIENTSNINFDAFRRTISKFEFNYYIRGTDLITPLELKEHIRSYVCSSYIETVIKYLTDLRLDDTLNVFISELASNKYIPGEYIISSVIKDDRFDFNFKTIEYCIHNSLISIEEFVDTFYIYRNRYDDDFLNNQLFELFYDRNNMLILLKILYNKYYIHEDNNGKIVMEYSCLSSSNDQYKGIEYIRKFLMDILKNDIERDIFFEFIERGRNYFISCSDKSRSMIYDKLFNWYADNLDSDLFSNNFLNKKYVDTYEGAPLSHEEILKMMSDVNTMNYLSAYEEMDAYNSFIRMINISRFNFFTFRRTMGINNMISRVYTCSFDREIVELSTNINMIAFILYL